MNQATQFEPLRELAKRVVATAGLELVHLELKGRGGTRLLQVFVDQPSGVGLADCERVSRALSQALDDASDTNLPGSYTLEVSSPGLDRQLYSRSDFDQFLGQRATVRTQLPLGGSRTFTGILDGHNEQGVRLRTSAAPAPVLTIAWDNVAQARLAPIFPVPERPQRPR